MWCQRGLDPPAWVVAWVGFHGCLELAVACTWALVTLCLLAMCGASPEWVGACPLELDGTLFAPLAWRYELETARSQVPYKYVILQLPVRRSRQDGEVR